MKTKHRGPCSISKAILYEIKANLAQEVHAKNSEIKHKATSYQHLLAQQNTVSQRPVQFLMGLVRLGQWVKERGEWVLG